VHHVNVRGDRALTLQHMLNERRPLSADVNEMLRHIHRLWGYDVHLHSVEPDGRTVRSYHLVADR
jgi:spore cortex formation protein SpoVR/YcgB (stage V sporulation)